MVVVGRYVLDGLIRIVARTRVKEAMTASALLTVVSVTLVMEHAGLSASLGAFIAGVLLADSDYRHEIEADIAPFEGLLLGLFFTAIGMSLNLRLIGREPLPGRGDRGRPARGQERRALRARPPRRAGVGPARRLALAIAQGGEFAFVLFTAGVAAGVLEQARRRPAVGRRHAVDGGDAAAATDRRDAGARARCVAQAFDTLPENDGHVVIAGFGRVGQIVARILRAKRIPFTALDSDPEQVDFVRKFGARIFYGDASRPEILEAAQTGKARAFVLAIDDVEASLRTAPDGAQHYPHVPIYAARAQPPPRAPAHGPGRPGHPPRDLPLLARPDARACCAASASPSATCASPSTPSWRRDARRLYEDYTHYTDLEKMQERAKRNAQELDEIFAQDAAEQAKAAAAAAKGAKAKAGKEP